MSMGGNKREENRVQKYVKNVKTRFFGILAHFFFFSFFDFSGPFEIKPGFPGFYRRAVQKKLKWGQQASKQRDSQYKKSSRIITCRASLSFSRL